MALPWSPRSLARRNEGPSLDLPAPGTSPARPPAAPAVVIFVIIVVMVAWLLGRHYSPAAALGVVSAAGALAATVGSWLAGAEPDAR